MYKLNEKRCFYDLSDGLAIIVNYYNGIYYGSDELGSIVLDRILKGNSPDAIIEAVKKLKGCPADIGDKMNDLIKGLQEKELIIDGDTVPGGNEDIEISVEADGFGLPLNEYAEVKDLILADPIHDVEVEQGWPFLKEGK